MNAQTNPISEMILPATNRRGFLRRAGLATAAAAFAPAAASLLTGQPHAEAAPLTNLDAAILNFALQTEYLGASYYSFAASGAGIDGNGGAISGAGTQGTVITKSSPMVPFNDPLVQQLANEFAVDELGHVAFLRDALASNNYPVYALPTIDLLNSFNAIYAAATNTPGATFDPFANDVNFLIGAFILDDTDVTAYAGSATLITSKGYLAAASGILGVEAYHAGSIRTNLFLRSQEPNSTATYGIDIVSTIQAISDLKNKLSGGTTTSYGATILGATSSEGLIRDGSANITAADANSIAFERNTREILNILYGAPGAASGGFFPNGLNGIIVD